MPLQTCRYAARQLYLDYWVSFLKNNSHCLPIFLILRTNKIIICHQTARVNTSSFFSEQVSSVVSIIITMSLDMLKDHVDFLHAFQNFLYQLLVDNFSNGWKTVNHNLPYNFSSYNCSRTWFTFRVEPGVSLPLFAPNSQTVDCILGICTYDNVRLLFFDGLIYSTVNGTKLGTLVCRRGGGIRPEVFTPTIMIRAAT